MLIKHTTNQSVTEAAAAFGLRIVSGMVLSDRRLRPELHQLPEAAYRDSISLIRRFHGHGRLLYAVTPRFALSTSEAMLEKALDSAEGRSPSVATDPNSVALQDALTQGTQTWSWIGVGQIMQRLRPFIEESFKDGSKEGDDTIASDIVNLFGGANAGLYAQGKYDGKTSQGTVFYPLDWDRALQLGGKFSKQANKNKIKPVIADDTL